MFSALGKSNLIDAVAFALALALPRGKHAHVRELVYSGGPPDDVAEGLGDDAARDMYVQLNFENGVSLKRSYSVRDQVSEQSVIEGRVETPLTMDEYKDRVRSLRLEIGEFCIYQDRLLSFSKQNLNDVFERLSGSDSHRDEFERLVETKSAIESQLRQVSDALKEKRYEKVKVKGLSDY